ncbi:MAG: thiamine phosphate synthase, partial [Pseudomonadota bacterium]
PSYLAFGPIYATTTKAMRFAPQGLERLRRWAQLTRGYPQVGIGGVDPSRVAGVMAQGVGSVCVVRAITTAADADAAIAALQAEVVRALRGHEAPDG